MFKSRLILRHWIFIIVGLLTMATASTNGCSPGFKSASNLQINLSSLVTDDMASGQKLYNTNCMGCHGGLVFSAKKGRSVAQISAAIESVANMKHLSVLSAEERNQIAAALAMTDTLCEATPPPGRTMAHRLDKFEYSNTLKSLLGITSNLGSDFPQETGAGGFTNNAAVLSVSPELVEQFVTNAGIAVDEAFSSQREKIVTCQTQDNACAQEILNRFTERAYRRPLKPGELDSVLALHQAALTNGENWEGALKIALQGVLSSPQFLFRTVEMSSPDDPQATTELNDYELASRLSYFVWSSPPDDELWELAKQGQLGQQQVLAEQVRRMLKDPKASALVDNFAWQWFGLEGLQENVLDEVVYPEYTPELKADMAQETRLLIEHIFKNDLSPYELLKADYTFVNQRLADLYNLKDFTGEGFRRTSLDPAYRAGILGHASILSMTSHDRSTSIIHRGKWVLDSILCDTPPPPPEGVSQPAELSESQRAAGRLANPACASCHQTIDNIGYGFENFSALGQWRTSDESGEPVVNAGEIPHLGRFEGPQQMRGLLEKDPRFSYCVTKKMLTYALGRLTSADQQCLVKSLSQQSVRPDTPISELIINIVFSDPFRKQQGAKGAL